MLPRPLIVPFSPTDCDIAAKWAVLAERGGVSYVRETGEERDTTLSEDQLTGQLSLLAGSRLLTGDIEAYRTARAYAFEQPSGSHPTPVRGSDVCFKGSLLRGPQPLWRYRLSVPPKEMRVGWTYALVLIPDLIVPLLVPGCSTFALIIGCATVRMFPDTIAGSGVFKGKYTLQVPQLDVIAPSHGIQYASDALIAALETHLGVREDERWAAVQPRWAHYATQGVTVVTV